MKILTEAKPFSAIDELPKTFTHMQTGNKGKFISEYYATGIGYITQIQLPDGAIYYAPSCEFKINLP